ncbi:glycine betaine/L-proline ABC transporter ATP-binding protein ProV [Halarcobacter ebronensis]|uniref:glycine betaine/L-proline ABC transporter ATP-binding protein ProV n=1 Tax=Halarcobacter ebronensis TaxID=1462615 RepID=UPI003C76E83E
MLNVIISEMEFNINSDKKKKLIVKNVFKVFGDEPKKALKMLNDGLSKEEIFDKTGMTIGVQDASFEIYEGEIFVIMGLSGSGKSTLVRLLNRLIEPTSGNIYIDETDVTNLNDKELIDIRREKISMVFQSFALMPHMNIIDNVSFGLELSGVTKNERYEKARKALEQVGLGQHELSYPDELSGGMQQRVGLARALANNPDIMLMDEAFSALDPLIRTEMQDELIELQSNEQRTIVFISHDLDEAIRIGDRIAIMQNGEISQIGTPEEIVNNPANDYIKSFFKGVDVTSVLTATHIAKKNNPTIIRREGTGIKSALQYLSDMDKDFGYIIEKNNAYVGLVTVESLKEQKSKGGTLETAIVEQKTINCETAISDFISDIAEASFPVAIVDDNNRYKGSISKAMLLRVLDEGVDNE